MIPYSPTPLTPWGVAREPLFPTSGIQCSECGECFPDTEAWNARECDQCNELVESDDGIPF